MRHRREPIDSRSWNQTGRKKKNEKWAQIDLQSEAEAKWWAVMKEERGESLPGTDALPIGTNQREQRAETLGNKPLQHSHNFTELRWEEV